MFDWYHGHSFAQGLFESADGKDQESSSEDAFFSYAIKMWGHYSGDTSMEARGNLMLSIQARTFSNYFLMQSNNVNEPPEFIGNKVMGIVSKTLSVSVFCGLTFDFSYSRTKWTILRTLAPTLSTLKGST